MGAKGVIGEGVFLKGAERWLHLGLGKGKGDRKTAGDKN